MFGHACDEPIAYIVGHPIDSLLLVCTTKCNLTLLDLSKNRSLRSFSIPPIFSKEITQYFKSPPIAMFFIDNITCRAIQSVIKSTIQNLPTEQFICLVFPKGVVTFDHSYLNCKFTPFDFTANCVAQAPDSLILGDSNGNIHVFSLTSLTSKKLCQVSGTPLGVFVSPIQGDSYGIIVPTQNGIELFKSSGPSASSIQAEMGRSFAYDPFTQILTTILDKRTVKMFSVTSQKIELIGECSFTGVVLGESKSTNYNVQQIAPCHLPCSPFPLFYALCDQSTLLICGRMSPLMRIESFPGPRIKKLNGSFMTSSLTDPAQLSIVSENMLLVVDMQAHLPQIVPTMPIPKFFKQQTHKDSIFTTYRKGDRTCIVDRCAKRFHVYDKSRKEISQGECYDAILGPQGKFAYLQITQAKKGSTSKIIIVDEALQKHELSVAPIDGLPSIQRLISFGDYLAVVVSSNQSDFGTNPQSQPRAGALSWRWSNYEPVTLQIEGTSQATYGDGYIAAASPTAYVVYSLVNNELKELCRRSVKVSHMKIYKGKLFLLSTEGLFIDNFKDLCLIASRYSHLVTIDRNTNRIPINAQYIARIDDKTVSVIDQAGNETTIGFTYTGEEPGQKTFLQTLASAPDPENALKSAFATAKDEDKRGILLCMLRYVDWSSVEPYILPSERAGTDEVLQTGATQNLNEFRQFLTSEMVLDV